MVLMITDECIRCGACMDECPTQAVSEGDLIHEIDPVKCNECVGFFDEPRCMSICSIGAVVKTSNTLSVNKNF